LISYLLYIDVMFFIYVDIYVCVRVRARMMYVCMYIYVCMFFNLPDTAYAINSQRLKSTWSLKIKSAETLTNSNAIAINSTSWLKLPEYERIPYLMQAIKLKSEHLLESAN